MDIILFHSISGLSLIIGAFIEICSFCFKTDTYKIPHTEDINICVTDDEINSNSKIAIEEQTKLT